jgi:glycerol-3-phosphate O-acyltransferase
MQSIISHYANTQTFSEKVFEKMAKAALQQLSQNQVITQGYYFDSATLKGYLTTLKKLGLAEITREHLLLAPDFVPQMQHRLAWYAQDHQDAFEHATQFSEKELKYFYDSVKVKKS